MLVYVDDIILIGANETKIHHVIIMLNAKFSLKYLGLLNYFLGIKVHYLPNEDILLNQGKYIKELLLKAKMDLSKSMPIPMASDVCFSTLIGDNNKTCHQLCR